MSPHVGEDPLSLMFALIPALIGALIALYLLVRVIQDHKLAQRVNAQRPDPKAFSDYPELQAMVDRFYLLRYRARQARAALPPAEQEARLSEMDAMIERGTDAAVRLRDAKEEPEIRAARAEIQEITASLEQMAQP